MAKYSVRIKRSAVKELQDIPTRADRKRIVDRIEKLADDPRPRGAKKLSGSERYRIRQGGYRILYTIEDTRLVVYIIRVADK